MVARAPTTSKGRRTRQALVDAAFDVFRQAGTVDVRISDITENAGLSPAAFYRYFDTKEELLAEVMEVFAARLSEAMRAADPAERDLPPFEQFRRANRRYLEAYARDGSLLRIVEQLLVADSVFVPMRRKVREAFVPRLQRRLATLQDAGEVAADVDVRLATPALSTMVQRVAYVLLVLSHHPEIHPRFADTLDLLWGNALGLRAGDAPSPAAAGPPDEVRKWATRGAVPVAPRVRFDPPDVVSPKGVATRDGLLAAARTVFERDGYIGARVADITAEAGVAHGTFYNYFDSRLDVFRVLAAKLHDDMVDAMRSTAVADLPSPFARLLVANRAFHDVYRANARLLAVIEQVATVDDDSAQARLDLRAWFVERNERVVRELQEHGMADPRLEAYSAAEALVSMAERMCFNWFVLGADHPKHAMDSLTVLWARALQMPIDVDPNTIHLIRPPRPH